MDVDDVQSLAKIRLCKVCGDAARVINYGALSCQSCKTFFRRNGFHSERVRPCQYDGECEVNMLTRKVCTACRLQKCFSVGMSADLIRKEDLHQKKSSSKQTQSVCQLPTLDLLNNDRSLLTRSQWTTLSNVIHAFDKFSLIPTLTEIGQNSSSSSIAGTIDFNIDDALKTFACSYTFMQSFLMTIPDFQVLTLNEQQSLLDRNLHGGTSLCSNLFYRDSHLFDNEQCSSSYIQLTGLEIFKQMKNHTHQLDPDSTILKVMLLILVFSSNSFMVDIQEKRSNDSLLQGTFRLLGSQHFYTDILWKYMIYRYGYEQTAIRFSHLITSILNKMTETTNIYMNNGIIYDYIDQMTENIKDMLVTGQKQVIPLWGKDIIN